MSVFGAATDNKSTVANSMMRMFTSGKTLVCTPYRQALYRYAEALATSKGGINKADIDTIRATYGTCAEDRGKAIWYLNFLQRRLGQGDEGRLTAAMVRTAAGVDFRHNEYK